MQKRPPANKRTMDDINPPVKKKPLKQVGRLTPQPRVLDDEVVRTMPITAKQLGRIKTMYGIK